MRRGWARGLVGQFAEQAGRGGTVVAVGGAAPLTEGALPYAPLLQALRTLADEHEPAAPGENRVELAGVLAELTFGGSPAGERLSAPEVGRGWLFERLCGVLGRLGRAAPVLLVLEDLHWADSATLDFLAFALRTLRGARLLVVGSYRADDPGEVLAGWLAEMRRLPEVSWLELPRFTRAELTAQLAGLRGGPVDGRVVAEVFDRSQGNPFYAEQLFAAGAGPQGYRCCCGRCCWPGCASCRRAASRYCGWRRWPAGGSAMTGWRPWPAGRRTS